MRRLARPAIGRVSAIAIGALTALCAMAIFEIWPAGQPADPAAALSQRVARVRDLHLPNIALTDHDGHRRLFYDELIKGRAVAINFMYAGCTRTCEVASQNLARLQEGLGERLGRDITLYSISLDPEHDTPAALAAYRAKQGARPGWSFLVPDSAADAVLLRRKLAVAESDPALDADISSHTGLIVVGNEPAARWTMIPALVHPIRIQQAIERILLPVDQWQRGAAVVEAVPREDTDRARMR